MLGEVLFEENRYFSADNVSKMDERFRGLLPRDADAILLRTYQSAWWITFECTCSEADLSEYSDRMDIELRESNVYETISIPDHETKASVLKFNNFHDDSNRWLVGDGNDGSRIEWLAFDRQNKKLFYSRSSR